MASFKDDLSGRFAALGIIIFVVLGVLFSRLWFLQVLAGEQYAELAEGNRIREISLEAPRGAIVDRNGASLVKNRPGLAVALPPTAITDKPLISRLSALLGVSPQEIAQQVNEKRADPLKARIIKHDAGIRAVSYIKEHRELFPGVEIESEAIRDYPNGTLAAHVLGYIGEISDREILLPDFKDYALGDIIGKTGVERQYEDVLQGVKGTRRLEVNASGRPLRVLKQEDPVQGRNLMLTIETSIQAATEKALDQALASARDQEMSNAFAGAAVVMNVTNGEIVALASRPIFDPRKFLGGISKRDWKRLNRKKSYYPLNNRALLSYAPGSTFKPVTAVAGLETGVASSTEDFYCPGKWTGMGDDWPKYCWNRSGHGGIGFVSGIAESCDTVFYEIGLRLYRRRLEELQAWARRFGVGAKSGIDLPGEVRGRVPDIAWKKAFNAKTPQYAQWMPGDTVNMAIGQGDVLMTPLQLANMYAAIANGGTFFKPHVMRAVMTPDGRLAAEKYEPVAVRRLKASREHLRVLQEGLRQVTTDGTARSAFEDFSLEVSGKTGTAEVAGKDDFAWFVGYAPSSSPKYVAVVMIEQGGHGGSVAAPAVRSILAALHGLPTDMVEAHDESR